MKSIIHSVFKHPLISGSSIIFVGSMMANIFNYLFNLGMGRLLTASDYGTLISLISIFNIFSVFSTTILTVFTKFSASYVGQKKENLIGPLFVTGSMWVGILSLLVCGAIIVFSYPISHFLNIEKTFLVIITGVALFFSFLSAVGFGILQGLLKFLYFSFSNIFSSMVKVLLGVGLIFFGFNIFGAITAFFVSILVGYIFVFPPLFNFLRNKNKENFTIPNLRKKLALYSLPVFLSSIGMSAFITIDVILVKHFFEPSVAGQYSAISIMGRSIFFAVSPIALVLFPLVAQKKERKESLTSIVFLSIFLIVIPSIILSFIYFVFPEIVRIIFYPTYEPKLINPYLGPFSVFILFYALSFILNVFYLSSGKIKVCILTIIGAILESVLICFFHKDIAQVINVLIFSSFLLLCSLLLYYPKATRASHS